MKGKLHSGESIVKEWAYSKGGNFVLTNQRLIQECRSKQTIYQNEVKLKEFSKIESTLTMGRVDALLLLNGIFLSFGGGFLVYFSKFSKKMAESTSGFFATIGILLLLLGILMIVVACLKAKKTGIQMTFYRPVREISDYHEVMSLDASNLTKNVSFSASAINRAVALDLFQSIGSFLLNDKEES